MNSASKARRAVSLMFITNGMLLANLLPRYPEIKSSLELSNTGLGLAVAMFPVGAVIAGLSAGYLLRRFGSAAVAAVTMIVTSIVLIGTGVAGSAVVFGLLMAIAGAGDSIADAAQNGHGMRVQRLYGRSIINAFHAMWSIGAVTGGLMAAGAIALQIPIAVHMAISATIITIIAVIAYKLALPGPDREPEEVASGEVSRVSSKTIVLIAAFGLIAIAGSFVEDIGNSWATLYMASEIGVTQALAAFGFVAMAGAQFIGRLCGDSLVDRFGDVRVAQGGAVLAFAGIAISVAFPSAATAILGFACAGFGCATWCPAAFAYADELPGLKPGTGVMLVSWLLRVGFLVSPPLVGLIGDHVSLRIGLLTVPVAAAVAFVCAFGFREVTPDPKR